jgi:hypothetical protein
MPNLTMCVTFRNTIFLKLPSLAGTEKVSCTHYESGFFYNEKCDSESHVCWGWSPWQVEGVDLVICSKIWGGTLTNGRVLWKAGSLSRRRKILLGKSSSKTQTNQKIVTIATENGTWLRIPRWLLGIFYSTMALQPLFGPWSLFQFLNIQRGPKNVLTLW